jgi:Mn2+/Fe2+ NRAMP family transporter
MHDASAQFSHLLAVSPGGGPGTLLKWVVVIAILGAVFLAWFLLRGYSDRD